MAQSEKIIISVELRDKGVTTGSKKAKKAVDDLTDSAKRLAKAEKDLAFQESQEGKELAALTIKKQLAVKARLRRVLTMPFLLRQVVLHLMLLMVCKVCRTT